MSDACTQGRRTSQPTLPRSRSLSSLVQEQGATLKRGDRKREGDTAVAEDSKRFKGSDEPVLQEQRTLSFNIPRSEWREVIGVFFFILKVRTNLSHCEVVRSIEHVESTQCTTCANMKE